MIVLGTLSGALVMEHVKGRIYRVKESFTYTTRGGRVITVPVGFEFDGGSVPRFLWFLYPPYGSECDEAFCVHDYLYAHAELFVGGDNGHISRGEADRIMLEIMELQGFRESGRRNVYGGVRVGGWKAWAKWRRLRAKENTGAR